jgi:hypothetical protein
MEVSAELGIKANITIINIRFNLTIKLDIYLEFIEKTCILLRI